MINLQTKEIVLYVDMLPLHVTDKEQNNWLTMNTCDIEMDPHPYKKKYPLEFQPCRHMAFTNTVLSLSIWQSSIISQNFFLSPYLWNISSNCTVCFVFTIYKCYINRAVVIQGIEIDCCCSNTTQILLKTLQLVIRKCYFTSYNICYSII